MIFSYCPTPGHEKPPKVGFCESALSTTIFVMRASAAVAASIAPAASARAMFRRRAGFISSPPLSTSNTSALARRAALIAVAAVVIIVPVAVALVLRFRVAAVVRVLEVSARLVLVLGDAVHARVGARLDVAAAMPAREKLRVAAAVVQRRLRIRAHRPAAQRRVLRHDRIGRVARLDPIHHRVEQRLRLRTRAADAMRDARREEKAEPVLQAPEAVVALRRLAVV